MGLTLANVTFDCADAEKLAGFWSAAVGRPVDAGASSDFATVGPEGTANPVLMFIRVPEPKSVKNRCHLDFTSPDRAGEVARLVDLGATHVADVEEHGFAWSTLLDPEGNELD